MSVAFNENLTGRINVDNLFDKAYVDAMGVPTYPAPGTHGDFLAAGKILTQRSRRDERRHGCPLLFPLEQYARCVPVAPSHSWQLCAVFARFLKSPSEKFGFMTRHLRQAA